MSKKRQDKMLTSEEYAALFDRINASNLTKADKTTVIAQIKNTFEYGLNGMLDFNFYSDITDL